MFHVPNHYRVKEGPLASEDRDGNNGVFSVHYIPKKIYLQIIASDGMGWEHVSVSTSRRTPIWEEMCGVKDIFWDEEDCVVQFHPPKSEYVNCHKFVLHLWRPIDQEILRPPSILVGPK